MAPAPMLASFSLGAALSMLPVGASIAQRPQPSVVELKRVVEQKEHDLGAAQIALAEARIRLARAEGKPDAAASECRSLLKEYEARLKVVRGLLAQGRLCSDESLRQAEGSVALARAWLAEAENNRDVLLIELPRVVAYHEWRIQWYNSLRKLKALPDEAAEEDLKESEADLRWARERLAGLRGKPTGKDKKGRGDKP